MARLDAIHADITSLEVDAVVNAANSRLQGGGGVDGAIHRAAGPRLLEATRDLGGCPTGECRITPGFAMPARWIIHTVGPVWAGGSADEAALLAACYRRSLLLGEAYSIERIAFPAISTGVYGYPMAEAAGIAVEAVRDTLPCTPGIGSVVFCCHSPDDLDVYRGLLGGF